LYKRIAVIGLGNTLRRDDGIGIIVFESLLNFYRKEGIDYFNFGTASFDLLHRMKDYDAVLLIDGIDAGLKPGELKIFELGDIEYDLKGSGSSSHELNLKNIFDLSEKFKLKAKIYVAGIQVEDTSHGEGLTETLQRNEKKIVEEIGSFIDNCLDRAYLKSVIKNRIKGHVAIVAIGNILRGDDGLGPKLIELLKPRSLGAALFDCGTAPENYVFPILSTSCDTMILVDAADIGKPAGSAKVFDLDEISNVSFSTHNPSPRLFTDLLKTGKDDINIFIISVQPKTTALGTGLSKEVLEGLSVLADILTEVLHK